MTALLNQAKINIMRYLLNILAISMLAVFVSCEKQEQTGLNGTDGNLKITLKCAQLENVGGTKSLDKENLPDEGTDTDYRVKDYWFFEYRSDGTYIDNSAKYIVVGSEEETKTPVVMPQEGEVYYCLFIANTHNQELFDPSINPEFEKYLREDKTLAGMAQFNKIISSLEETYNVAEKDLVMSGVAELKYQANELKCFLYRNIAKVTVKLINKEDSDLTIKSVNIKNVPGTAMYADALFKVTSLPGVTPPAAPFPDNYSVSYFDYEIDNINIASNTEESFVWYLPRNMRGKVEGIASADQKNSKAPEFATYIEIFATTSAGELFRYRFYMGANATTDFNVEPNKHYTLPITFIDKGNVILDSRITDFSKVALSGMSNSYIINPLPIELQPVYQLPVTKVNQFWSSADAPAGVDNIIGETTEWVAEVIWQDQPARLVNFKDANRNNVDIFAATGLTPILFEVQVPKDAEGNVLKRPEGNVLIGVRKKGETKYLWSWHLWITDYNPDDCSTPWETGKYVYSVPGGEVHRYAGEFWETNYQNRYIMDRNLGALSANSTDDIEKTGGFVYQFGRKDPIPYTNINASGATTDYTNVNIYNIKGEVINFSGNDGNPIPLEQKQVEIYESVYSPFNFYYSGVDWVKNNRYSSYNYVWNGTKSNEKSMYDPCPEGWMVPKDGVWEIFGNRGSNANKNDKDPNYNQKNAGVEFYIDAPKEGTHKSHNVAYFPAMGIRHASGGYSDAYKTRGFMHNTQAATANSRIDRWGFAILETKIVSIVNKTDNISKLATRNHALNIRCIREKDNVGNNDNENNKKNEEYNQVPW